MQQTLLQTNKAQQSIVIFLRFNESWRAEKSFLLFFLGMKTWISVVNYFYCLLSNFEIESTKYFKDAENDYTTILKLLLAGYFAPRLHAVCDLSRI